MRDPLVVDGRTQASIEKVVPDGISNELSVLDPKN